jgi:ubiquitin-like domain-containing CTD phosphatase 1
VDDFDVKYSAHPAVQGKPVIAPADDPRNKRKINEIVKNVPITVGLTAKGGLIVRS